MSSFREKAQVFIIGLSIGLLVAGAFFIFKLDDYFKELSLYKKVSQTFSSQPAPAETTPAEEKTEEKKSKGKSPKAPNNETLATNAAGGEVLDHDTLKQSLNRSDSINQSFVAGDDVVVRKDELLSTKTLEVFNLSATASKMSAKDSLLQKVSGIKDDRRDDKEMFNIEFWSSPLNYKGYKMGKYKIVLYGIPSAEGLKVYKLDDVVYLKHQSNVYRLDYASDFKQYERITDENIIGKLK